MLELKPDTDKRIYASAYDANRISEYQDGAIVSSTILKKSTGNITIFAFDEGQSLSEHTAPFDALVYIIDGTAEILISKESHKVGAGQMILIPANEPHALKATSKFKMMLIMIKS